MKYLPILALALAGCTAGQQQTQLQIADRISKGINEVAPTIVDQYKVDLRACRSSAQSLLEYKVCASEVDSKWEHFRTVWARARSMQADYAKALENREPSLSDFAEWVQMSYCQLKAVAPSSLKLPEVPGLVCKDAD